MDKLIFYILQPSELMKIGIILCLAKYYHRIQLNKVNSFTNILTVLVILTVPIMLVISQPDLGTSILIALSGIVVLWLAGFNIKYFFYSFLNNDLNAIYYFIFKTLSKTKNFNIS